VKGEALHAPTKGERLNFKEGKEMEKTFVGKETNKKAETKKPRRNNFVDGTEN
jgi:hypothetical protein